MKLLELTLHAYGSFRDRRLDFSHPAPALHLIYGPNEAGKSTTLRAIVGLLYGIDHQSRDAYLHTGPNLRIGARVVDARGQELAFLRRKGTKNTLLDLAGEAADEAHLTRMLGGLPESVFTSMFGLDHERLRIGGEQLGRGHGDLGESLFQAGAGAPGVHEALHALSQEADELFRPRGKRLLNQAVRAYEDARRQVREQGKRADGFRVQEQELDRNRELLAALHARRQELLAEQNRLQRALRVLPGLAKRRRLIEQRAELGPVVILPEDAADARREAIAQLSACDVQCAQLRKAIATLELRRGELIVPESLAGLGPEFVRNVRLRLGSHLKAAEDLPHRAIELRALEQEAAARLRALGDPALLSEVESLRVDSATTARIHKLAAEQSGVREKAEAAERDLLAAEAAIEQARAELAALPAAALPLASARDSVPRLPSEATVSAFRLRFERIEQSQARVREKEDALAERESRTLRALDTIAREGAPPTEQDLQDARSERDALWRELQAAIDDATAPLRERLTQYHALQQRADDLADRLRREARRVSELAGLLAERDAIARERAILEQRRSEIEVEVAQLEAEWRALWSALGVLPRPPLEMQAVLGKVAGLIESGERGRAQATRRRYEAQQALVRFETDWALAMARLRLPAAASVAEVQVVLDELRRLFAQVDAIGQLRTRIDAMQRDAHTFESEVRGLVQRHLPELEPVAIEQAAEELAARYDRARRDVEQRARIDQDLREAREQLLALEQRGMHAGRAATALMRAARVSNMEALEAAERASDQARALDGALQEVEDELLSHGEGASIAVLITETAGLQPDLSRARLEDIKDELERVAEDQGSAAHAIGSIEAGLELMRRDDSAAQAAAEAEQQLCRIKAYARSYARKRIAAELLAQQIRRYRDRNQGPILTRARELFARMTLGRYPSLQVGYKDGDEPVLLCVDARGRSVALPALSDGTRDQLYLALRLASVMRFAEHAEPMPLVLDDVLIHFDDQRARAALKVLGEFTETTQVLFFTHHARLVELAREALPEGRLIEHRLIEDDEPRDALPV